jgi:hypothetical protein
MDISIPVSEQVALEALENCRYRSGMHTWHPDALKLRLWRFPAYGDWWSWSAFGPTRNGHYCIRRVQWARSELRSEAVTFAEDANVDKEEIEALFVALETLELSPFSASRHVVMDGECAGVEFFGGAHSTKLQWAGKIPTTLAALSSWFENAARLLDSKFKLPAYG